MSAPGKARSSHGASSPRSSSFKGQIYWVPVRIVGKLGQVRDEQEMKRLASRDMFSLRDREVEVLPHDFSGLSEDGWRKRM